MTYPCPRCLQTALRCDHEGREAGNVVWRIFHCLTCSFSWRDSEPASAIDPVSRDTDFRVDADKTDSLPIVLAPVRR